MNKLEELKKELKYHNEQEECHKGAASNHRYQAELCKSQIEKLEPKRGDWYYTPNYRSRIFYDKLSWCDDSLDNLLYECGMVFRTEEEAAEKGKAEYYTKRFAAKSDVTDEMNRIVDITKWYALWDYEDKSIYFYSWCVIEQQGSVSFSSRAKLKEAIAEIGEDNFKRYVLGVKE